MERSVAQKLEALLKLQAIDSQLDEINKIKGDLPEEVRDLEDEIIGYQTRVQKFNDEVKALNEEIESKKQRKKDADKLITKYKDQQLNVRNNREYEAILKEIESEELEIQLADKKIREANEKIIKKNEEISETQTNLEDRKKDLTNKQKELDNLMKESQGDEDKLKKDRDKQAKHVEERILRSYNKIRSNAINGLAVVEVIRDACGGCFAIVPPQRQAEIREKKKIIVCEHCGRIFAGVEDIIEEEVEVAPVKKTRKTKAKK